MSTAPAPTGALSRRGTQEPAGPQTKPSDTTRAAPHVSRLAQGSGHPPLCAHGMNPLTDKAYDLALGWLRRG